MKWVDFAVNKKLGYLCGIVNIIQKTNGGKFMKKVLLILLCVVMLGLAGCTSGGNENRVTLNNGFTQNDNNFLKDLHYQLTSKDLFSQLEDSKNNE